MVDAADWIMLNCYLDPVGSLEDRPEQNGSLMWMRKRVILVMAEDRTLHGRRCIALERRAGQFSASLLHALMA